MEKGPERSSQHETLKKAFLKIEELQKRLASAEQTERQPIAVVGIACRFPGGVRNIEDYWRLLTEGRNAIRDVPSDRWDVDGFYDPNPEVPGKMYSRKGGFLDGVDQFDPQFFGITPREVLHMDPQQRILLEVTWEALERAGIAPDTLAGSKTGVFTGIGFNDYSRLLSQLDLTEMNAYTGPGTQVCFASGRVSYTLGLRGPSVPIDTACSSSLVATHLACQSLRQRESDLVLAGGVNLVLVPEGNVWLSRAGALAPDGHCKTFDASANGFVRGEGCAVMVLKRLDDAIRDGNTILAVIRGSAVNHDGRSSGLTVPSGPAQEALLRQALANAGLQPEQVSYLEAHGTGTSLGDPIEMRALLSVLGRAGTQARKTPLTIGSVKTNLGHLEAASGIAGLIKVVLMLRHRQIPPHLHFSKLNPVVALDGVDLRVPTELGDWTTETGRTRVAGVSSFGLSGTNGHVLLEEAPAQTPSTTNVAEESRILPLSAARPEALKALATSYLEFVTTNPDELADTCFTAANGRNHMDHRLALIAETPEDAAKALRAFVEGRVVENLFSGRRPLTGTLKLAFVFPDSTSFDVDRLARATATLLADATFAKAFAECDAAFVKRGYPSLVEAVRHHDGSVGEYARLGGAELLLFCFQLALAERFQAWGIQPDAVVGCSVGEVAAAVISGALDLDAAAALVLERKATANAVWSGSPRRGSVPLSSTQSGKLCSGLELDAAYWSRSLTLPPDLQGALRALVADDVRVFLDLSPDFAHTAAVGTMLDALGSAMVVARSCSATGRRALLSAIAELYCLGYTPEFRSVLPSGRTLSNLPTYPWQHQRYWIDLKTRAVGRQREGKAHPLLGHSLPAHAARPECVVWEMDLGPEARSNPASQLVAGQRRVSSATFAGLALAAAKELFSDGFASVADLQLHQPLVLSERQRAVLQVSVGAEAGGGRSFHVHSRAADVAESSSKWVLHATAKLAKN
ncbi:MAG: type I polyketide synthase [Myxococcota bacterium]